ncbi:MAG: SBBP repeat-containing protein [Ignavibacteria bacterium]|nr:SBBP repeat-containing protein [Ignavibacteria bacterium]
MVLIKKYFNSDLLFIRASFLLALFLLSTSVYSQYQQQWVKRFSGTLVNGTNYGYSLGVDRQDNIYVAGYIKNVQTLYDYFLIKYTPSGNMIWNRSYNGTGNNWDLCYSLAVDDFGNAYITGTATNASSLSECVTLKFDSSGNLRWTNIYNFGVNQPDYGKVVKIYKNKSIYVFGGSALNENENDLLLIKIDSSGTQEWVRRNRGRNVSTEAADMVLDKSGNIYVTGLSIVSQTGWDFITVKYSGNGDTVWSRTFDYDHLVNTPTAMAIDSLGNIFVTGQSINNSTNKAYLTVVKYDSTGVLKWYKVYQHDTLNFFDLGMCIGVDKNNNIYVTGYTSNSGSLPDTRDFVTIRYKQNGDTAWVRNYNGIGNGMDWPRGLTIDRQCNVYVTGLSAGTGGYYSDYYTISYDSLGNTLWSSRYNGSLNYGDTPLSIILDNAQNVIVTGSACETGTGSDAVTIKYSKNVGIQNIGETVPVNYLLYQNYPEPFNPSTTIKYALPKNGFVSISVFDITGREITKLVNEMKRAGNYQVLFDGSGFASGVYFYRIVTEDFVQTKRMVMVK